MVSGGFTFVAGQLRSDLDVDFAAANEPEIVKGVLTSKARRVTPARRAVRHACLFQIEVVGVSAHKPTCSKAWLSSLALGHQRQGRGYLGEPTPTWAQDQV